MGICSARSGSAYLIISCVDGKDLKALGIVPELNDHFTLRPQACTCSVSRALLNRARIRHLQLSRRLHPPHLPPTPSSSPLSDSATAHPCPPSPASPSPSPNHYPQPTESSQTQTCAPPYPHPSTPSPSPPASSHDDTPDTGSNQTASSPPPSTPHGAPDP